MSYIRHIVKILFILIMDLYVEYRDVKNNFLKWKITSPKNRIIFHYMKK